MTFFTGDKIKATLNKIRSKLKYGSIKISLTYSLIGFVSIYLSNKLIRRVTDNNRIIVYRQSIYMIITAIIIYILIRNLEEKLKEQLEKIIDGKEKLRESEERNSAILRAVPDLLFVLDKNGDFTDTMVSNESKLYVPRNSFLGKNLHEIMPSDIADLAYDKIQLVLKHGSLESFEYELEGQNFDLRLAKINDKEVLAISRDISDRKKMEQKLQYLSYHDQLTGIYNRRFFEEELASIDVDANLPLTMVMADVNGLKLINDSFGHVMGDELIKRVVKIINNGCRKNDIVARLGGDEFIVLMPNTNSQEAEQIIRETKLLAANEKIESVEVSISFGYETKINKNEKLEEVFKKAEDHMYNEKMVESPRMKGKTINAIISALNEKNKMEEQHSIRVSKLCEDVGRVLNLPKEEINELRTIGLLHDIGKIAVDQNVLNKIEKPTREEFEEIKKHTEIGYRILNTVNELSRMSEYVLAHHEKWDGTGYPKGLKGEEIPFKSRIVTIVDSYDTMISERSYRLPMSQEAAIQELKANAGKQFDPELVKVFVEQVLEKSF
ncbi:HD domain-containing phosphohydrolase [Clostridium hydrogenum]|uniref:HD domain-containing phosphohydrolase n=1 Tax=Clostridium hydrogenum TaxID=2855764 RepID=UPI001F28159F|nr:HD domain-containing phosphohydrolase [Clostridium hydrogenum]